MKITFTTRDGKDIQRDLPEFDDASIEAVRVEIEREIGQPLPLSSRTGFPEFAVHDEDGSGVGGG